MKRQSLSGYGKRFFYDKSIKQGSIQAEIKEVFL